MHREKTTRAKKKEGEGGEKRWGASGAWESQKGKGEFA